MSAAWYIVLERNIPGFDPSVNGKALAHANKVLEALAEKAGVPSLMHFFSVSPEDSAGFAEDPNVDLNKKATRSASTKWFPAEDGLATVCALLQEADKAKMSQSEKIVADLMEFKNVLEVARSNGVAWRLAVDF